MKKDKSMSKISTKLCSKATFKKNPNTVAVGGLGCSNPTMGNYKQGRAYMRGQGTKRTNRGGRTEHTNIRGANEQNTHMGGTNETRNTQTIFVTDMQADLLFT